MLYLIIHNIPGLPQPATQAWRALHKSFTSARDAFELWEIGPEDTVTLVEINPVTASWKPMITRYGRNHQTLIKLLGRADAVTERLVAQRKQDVSAEPLTDDEIRRSTEAAMRVAAYERNRA